MTRPAATTFWRMPMPSAARTRARRGSTARILRTSRPTGSSGGWLNWRLRSGRRLTGQSQSDECLYRRPTANSDRSASRACGMGLHDSSTAGAGTDLQSRSSARNLRLPCRAKRPASGRRGGGAAIPWPPGPRQYTTGGKPRLGGIGRRANHYLRRQLIHGARAIVSRSAKHDDRQSTWLKALVARRGFNRTIVALANKTARIAWVLLSRKEEYAAP